MTMPTSKAKLWSGFVDIIGHVADLVGSVGIHGKLGRVGSSRGWVKAELIVTWAEYMAKIIG